MQPNAASSTSLRLSRRRLLLLAGGAAAVGTGLLAAGKAAYAFEAGHTSTVADAVAAAATTTTGDSAAPAASAAPGRRLMEQTSQTGFAPINSKLTFGAPTDLASGWDGTVWAIDAAGAPHQYDAITDRWELFGLGLDAAALIQDAGPAVYFRGAEVFVADGKTPLRTIAELWPTLPASYKLGVKGAAWANGQLYVFRGGTFIGVPWAGVSAATSDASPPTAQPLTSLPGWSQTADWKDGVVDAVFSIGRSTVLFIRGGQFVTYDFSRPQVAVSVPTQLNQQAVFQSLPSEWLGDGFDGGFCCVGGPAAGNTYAFKGPQVLVYRTPGSSSEAKPAGSTSEATDTPAAQASDMATPRPAEIDATPT
ncbi:MAG: hypothetical protein JOZ87_31150, partial [Chloroflexi bacterium]|nr:hypothetical protein [Chloroflexota bacterium]